MEHADTLLTLAEVSIAFAGFTSVVVIFRRREAGWLPSDAFRFQAMLVVSLSCLLFSVLPVVLHSYGVREDALWGGTSAAMALALAGGLVASRPFLRELAERPDWSSNLSRILSFGQVIVLTLLVLNAVSLGFRREPGPYLTGLLWMLLLCSNYFVRLVAIRWVEISEGDEE